MHQYCLNTIPHTKNYSTLNNWLTTNLIIFRQGAVNKWRHAIFWPSLFYALTSVTERLTLSMCDVIYEWPPSQAFFHVHFAHVLRAGTWKIKCVCRKTLAELNMRQNWVVKIPPWKTLLLGGRCGWGGLTGHSMGGWLFFLNVIYYLPRAWWKRQ